MAGMADKVPDSGSLALVPVIRLGVSVERWHRSVLALPLEDRIIQHQQRSWMRDCLHL